MNGTFDFSSIGNYRLAGRIPYPPAAVGRITPRLRMAIQFDLREGEELRLDNMIARLTSGQEIVGDALIVGEQAHRSIPIQLEFTTSARVLAWLTDGLAAGPDFSLQLDLRGSFRHRTSAGDAAAAWTEDRLPVSAPAWLSLARSEWFEQVLKPTRDADYLYLEVAMPRGTAAAAWRHADARLRDAEAALANGDDTAVFHHLRGAFDAMIGACRRRGDLGPQSQGLGGAVLLSDHVREVGRVRRCVTLRLLRTVDAVSP